MQPNRCAAAIAAIAAVLTTACGSASDADAGKPAQAGDATALPYYCPMHPSYRSDRPGTCPICNMDLVRGERAAPEPASPVAGRAEVAIDGEGARKIGLAVATVEKRPFSRRIRAAARVEADERGLSSVSARYAGWIEGAQIPATGAAVRVGDPLVSVYSPELSEAQRTYLLARKALPAEDAAVRSARERLLAWDMTEAQVAELEARGEPGRTTELLAKTAGVVTKRAATSGMRFEPGMVLFELADLTTVWVVADVYADELSLVRPGAKALVEIPSSEVEPIAGRVSFVYPTIAEATRTARVRIDVPNREGRLLPGAYAVAELEADLGEQVVVAVDSVLDTGTRSLVFVEVAEGRFAPREVRLGPRSGGNAAVLSGLEPGEKVVARAAFLVDSESRLQAAFRGHGHP